MFSSSAGANPAYTASADVDFAGVFKKYAEEKSQLLKKIADTRKESLSAEEQRSLDHLNAFFALHFGTHQDETSLLCEWHVPEAHYLETWGDIRGHDGTASIQQPLIAPLYSGKSIGEFLADITSAPYREGFDIVRNYWRERLRDRKAERGELRDLLAGIGAVRRDSRNGRRNQKPLRSRATGRPTHLRPRLPAAGSNEYEINFRADPTLYDGRFANNGWLQECPKPLTKMTWDNARLREPSKTAEARASRRTSAGPAASTAAPK